jgi:hypothetical protein
MARVTKTIEAVLLNIPSHVKIGAHTYTIYQMDALWGSENARHGECIPDKLEINICMGSCYSIIYETLIHEIMHAIYAPALESGDSEERIVNAMGVGFTQVLTDNPKLLNFINHTPSGDLDKIEVNASYPSRSSLWPGTG